MKTLAVLLTLAAAPAGTGQIGGYDARIEQGKLTIGPGKVRYEGTVAGSGMNLLVTGTQGHQYRLNCQREPVDSK